MQHKKTIVSTLERFKRLPDEINELNNKNLSDELKAMGAEGVNPKRYALINLLQGFITLKQKKNEGGVFGLGLISKTTVKKTLENSDLHAKYKEEFKQFEKTKDYAKDVVHFFDSKKDRAACENYFKILKALESYKTLDDLINVRSYIQAYCKQNTVGTKFSQYLTQQFLPVLNNIINPLQTKINEQRKKRERELQTKGFNIHKDIMEKLPQALKRIENPEVKKAYARFNKEYLTKKLNDADKKLADNTERWEKLKHLPEILIAKKAKYNKFVEDTKAEIKSLEQKIKNKEHLKIEAYNRNVKLDTHNLHGDLIPGDKYNAQSIKEEYESEINNHLSAIEKNKRELESEIAELQKEKNSLPQRIAFLTSERERIQVEYKSSPESISTEEFIKTISSDEYQKQMRNIPEQTFELLDKLLSPFDLNNKFLDELRDDFFPKEQKQQLPSAPPAQALDQVFIGEIPAYEDKVTSPLPSAPIASEHLVNNLFVGEIPIHKETVTSPLPSAPLASEEMLSQNNNVVDVPLPKEYDLEHPMPFAPGQVADPIGVVSEPPVRQENDLKQPMFSTSVQEGASSQLPQQQIIFAPNIFVDDVIDEQPGLDVTSILALEVPTKEEKNDEQPGLETTSSSEALSSTGTMVLNMLRDKSNSVDETPSIQTTRNIANQDQDLDEQNETKLRETKKSEPNLSTKEKVLNASENSSSFWSTTAADRPANAQPLTTEIEKVKIKETSKGKILKLGGN